jgi:osmotically-inducible protein OsmY
MPRHGEGGFHFQRFHQKGVVMKFLTACLSMAMAAALTACAPTPTSRGTGQVIDDAAITARVNTEIAQTQGLPEAAAINVTTYRGVVSLSGFVDTREQIAAAVQAARRVPGVEDVKNNLQVKPRPE